MWNLYTLQAISNLKAGPNLRSRPSVGRDLSFCLADEPQLPAVAAFTHGKVEPDGTASVALDEEFVKVLAAFIADVQQDDSIAEGLLHAADADVGGTAGEMIGGRGTADGFIHRRRAEAAVNHYRVITITVVTIPLAAKLL